MREGKREGTVNKKIAEVEVEVEVEVELPTGVVGVVSVTCDVLLEVLHLEVLHLDFRTNKSPEKVVPVRKIILDSWFLQLF